LNCSTKLIAVFEIRAMRTSAALLSLVFLFNGLAKAHDISRSDSKVEIEGREVRVALTLNVRELKNPVITAHTLSTEDIQRIFEAVERNYFVSSPSAPVKTTLETYSALGGPLIQLRILNVFALDVHRLDVKSTLYRIMPAGHQHLISVRLNGILHEAILDAKTPEAAFSGTQATSLQTMWRFIRLGVEHIFTGYDHLAFLLGLLVATSTPGSLVKIVTSFTIAHSITLALATFNLVLLPSRLTESLIALSIVWVAAENLLDFRVMKRYYITFLFGLVHGFGFSNVLREMDLPKSSLALSLFSFNAGVEIGQVTFVLLLFPLVQDLASSGWKRLKPAVSIGVACLGLYWFAERAFRG
jgi:hydrogenase/urease accessory protein HupE